MGDPITDTRKWVADFVVAYNVCPFAHKVVSEDSIHYAVIDSDDFETILQRFVVEFYELEDDERRSTTLVILSRQLNFDQYLDLLELANRLLVIQGFEGIYQIASFHPDYCFEGMEEDDPENYTNRSPWPMLHIIREKAIEEVLFRYPDPENIPRRNQQKMQDLGVEFLQKFIHSKI